ncbi:MAG: hypothetical protein JKY94_09155 [Rhodobacteraceae bacterium]|nr:hypothetical protein [Paracoccaceae bacterium]
MNAHAQTTVPEWVTNCDSTSDLTEQLHEADPEAREYGYACTGYYNHADGFASNHRHEDVTCIVAVLVGIEIDHGHGLIYRHDAREAALILSDDVMCRIDNLDVVDGVAA